MVTAAVAGDDVKIDLIWVNDWEFAAIGNWIACNKDECWWW